MLILCQVFYISLKSLSGTQRWWDGGGSGLYFYSQPPSFCHEVSGSFKVTQPDTAASDQELWLFLCPLVPMPFKVDASCEQGVGLGQKETFLETSCYEIALSFHGQVR